MLVEAMQALYDYSRQATERILDTAERLTPEQWLAPQTAGRGSIRDTLVHLVSAQGSWLTTWGGPLPSGGASRGPVVPADFPDVTAVRSLLKTVDGATQAFLTELTDEALARVIVRQRAAGGEMRATLWQMMLHVANHGTQHRSEVAAFLTAFNHSPGDIDFLRFIPTPR